MPGCSRTMSSAWLPRVPEPRGRPPPRRPPLRWGMGRVLRPDGGVAAAPASAFAAASRRWYSSTCGRSSSMRASISRLFSSRKSATSRPVCHVCTPIHLPVNDCVTQQMSGIGGLDESLERGQRGVRLMCGDAAHHGLCGDRAHRPERCVELVAVVEVRAGRGRREAVLDDRTCARRALALPPCEERRLHFLQRPLHFERHPPRAGAPGHLGAPDERGVVPPPARAGGGHPVLRGAWVHRDLPHPPPAGGGGG